MSLRPTLFAAAALLALVSCSNTRDLGNLPDQSSDAGSDGAGGQGWNVNPCDGATTFICAGSAAKVCNLADCPPEPTSDGGGGQGWNAIPCDGAAVWVCADATKVCNLADCPP